MPLSSNCTADPVLRTVGRVPLGHHHKGQLKIRWNLKVTGHRLGAAAT